ncbi:MAG: hypothetical protein AAGG68_22615 [Bacteroidota bacterium]
MRYRYMFPITGITWHQYTDLVLNNYGLIKDILNNLLDLSNYGSSVEGLAFLYIVDQPGRDFHQENIKFNKKQKELYGQFVLNAEAILDLEEQEILAVMAKMYWERTADFRKFKFEDFDLAAFRADVKEMFETTGLMNIEKAASDENSTRATSR